MAEILVQRAGSLDEFTRQTAITWVGFYIHAIPLNISFHEVIELLYAM